MKLTRQIRRAACRKLAKEALAAMPVKETRRDNHESVKLLAKRMFERAPKDLEPSRIIRPPAPRIVTVEQAVNEFNEGQPLPPTPEPVPRKRILLIG